jgi:hypothetical protein
MAHSGGEVGVGVAHCWLPRPWPRPLLSQRGGESGRPGSLHGGLTMRPEFPRSQSGGTGVGVSGAGSQGGLRGSAGGDTGGETQPVDSPQ